MNKRQGKKANKEILNDLKELSRIHKVLSELGVININANEGFVECHLLLADFVRLPFISKREIKLVDYGDTHIPFEARYSCNGVEFFSLVSFEQVRKYFPEKIKQSQNYIEIAGVKYLKESAN
ncbi:hypothetical protein [Enterococcus mundtii]|uniref:hypothetical protein n=1 Tax=Enterococcus mundtii TaxID=53346 RepID=UPI000D35042E|nr:hypothetical protein [Enterococcus mundtii]PTO41129.1 hypothetical protein C6P54_13915 [Enterococcus mundtii]